MRFGRAIQGRAAWGKSPAMPPSRLQPLYPDRRRRRGPPLKILLLILLVALVAFILYASTVNTEVAPSRIEQDVTDALPKG
jgi:hypothetical protein